MVLGNPRMKTVQVVNFFLSTSRNNILRQRRVGDIANADPHGHAAVRRPADSRGDLADDQRGAHPAVHTHRARKAMGERGFVFNSFFLHANLPYE